MAAHQVSSGWQVEGSGPEAYERHLVPRIFAPSADVLIARTNVTAGDRVLDVGCGTGIVARRAALQAGRDGSVIGVDVNPSMLAVARAAEGAGGITWREADAAELPFAESSFDVVLSQQVLQFLPDAAAALREMHRVLAPGGRLGLSVYRGLAYHPVYAAFADALARHVGEGAAAMMRSPFANWTREDLHARLEAAGFGEVRVRDVVSEVRYPGVEAFLREEVASSPLAARVGATDARVQDALLADLRESLSERVDDDGIAFPMEAFVVVAAK